MPLQKNNAILYTTQNRDIYHSNNVVKLLYYLVEYWKITSSDPTELAYILSL
jgi:hypothetical protein